MSSQKKRLVMGSRFSAFWLSCFPSINTRRAAAARASHTAPGHSTAKVAKVQALFATHCGRNSGATCQGVTPWPNPEMPSLLWRTCCFFLCRGVREMMSPASTFDEEEGKLQAAIYSVQSQRGFPCGEIDSWFDTLQKIQGGKKSYTIPYSRRQDNTYIQSTSVNIKA